MRRREAPLTPEFEEPSKLIDDYLLADARNLNDSVEGPDRYVARGVYVVTVLAQMERDPKGPVPLSKEELNERYNKGLERAVEEYGGTAAPPIDMDFPSWMAYLHTWLYPGMVVTEDPISHFGLMRALHDEHRAWFRPKLKPEQQ